MIGEVLQPTDEQFQFPLFGFSIRLDLGLCLETGQLRARLTHARLKLFFV